MIYLVIVLCNATGTCKDLTTLVAPTPGASPVFECMRYGESEAAKMVAANPGWYIRRWVCSAKPPARGGLIMTEAERRLLLLMAELMIVLLDQAGMNVFADDVFEARHAVATDGLDPEKIGPNCTRPDSSLR